MQIRLTNAAVQKIRDELALLERTERPRIAERIKSARSYGDISENYEYHAAKEEQGLLEARIRELRAVLSRAHVVEPRRDGSTAGLGSRVTVRDEDYDEETVYTIVTMIDADPMNDRISDQSPIGKAICGKRAGDGVEINAPGGTLRLQIVKVEHGDV